MALGATIVVALAQFNASHVDGWGLRCRGDENALVASGLLNATGALRWGRAEVCCVAGPEWRRDDMAQAAVDWLMGYGRPLPAVHLVRKRWALPPIGPVLNDVCATLLP